MAKTISMEKGFQLKAVENTLSAFQKLLNEKGTLEKRLEEINTTLETVGNFLKSGGTIVESNKKGRIPGAVDIKPRLRRTYKEEFMGLTPDETIRYRKTGKLPNGKVEPTEKEVREYMQMKKQERTKVS